MKKRVFKKGGMAVSQIIILIFGIVAIGYVIGGSIPLVNAHGAFDYDDFPAQEGTITTEEKKAALKTEGFKDKDLEEATKEVIDNWYGLFVIDKEDTQSSGGKGEEVESPDPAVTALATASLAGSSILPDLGAKKSIAEEIGEVEIAREERALKEAAEKAAKEARELANAKKIESWWKRDGKQVLKNAQWGATIYFGIKFVLGSFVKDKQVIDALAEAGGAGYFLGKTFGGDFSKLDLRKIIGISNPLFIGLTMAAIFLARYKGEAQEVVTFSCYAWDAPTKGADCEKCNQKGELPCSEYQCRSLGQSCELINKGTTEELCIWRHQNDIKFPTIEVWEDALLNKDYSYEDQDVGISPPDRGVRIDYAPAGGCVKAFTPFSFGVSLDEPGHCKLDVTRKVNFEDMVFEFSNGISRYNHSYVLSLPGTSALQAENITVQNDGEYEVYVRCMDANENVNPANFVFKYCVQKGPDTTPPLVVATSVLNDHPVGFGEDSVSITVYTNEPADCKWTHEIDKSYIDMEETMDGCAERIADSNEQMLYECQTTLTGIKDRQRNNFYIRCKDQPLLEGKEDEKQFRNEMREGYKLTIIGTQPLIIDTVLPNGTIKDSTEFVKVVFEVETSAGYDEGKSVCSYKKSEDPISDYLEFANTDSHRHSQDLWFEEGDYDYDISCEDLGGNSDTKTVHFHVETDTEAPVVVRAFKEELNLRIITNEEAECVYSTSSSTGCNYLFEPDGLSMVRTNNVNHFVEWNPNINYYIKCQDEYGNQPQPPNECSIIVKPFDIS